MYLCTIVWSTRGVGICRVTQGQPSLKQIFFWNYFRAIFEPIVTRQSHLGSTDDKSCTALFPHTPSLTGDGEPHCGIWWRGWLSHLPWSWLWLHHYTKCVLHIVSSNMPRIECRIYCRSDADRNRSQDLPNIETVTQLGRKGSSQV